MRRESWMLAGIVAALAAAAPVQAQRMGSPISVSRGQAYVFPYAGYMFTQHFANGPLGTSLGNANAAVYGGQVGLPLSPNASLVGGIAYSTADLQAKGPIVGGVAVGKSVAWLYEGDVELRFPQRSMGGQSEGSFVPFVQLGAGAIHRRLNAIGLYATATDFAGNGGIGFDYVLSPGFGLRLMAKDYIGKATFDSDLAQTNTLNNLSLSAGVRLSF